MLGPSQPPIFNQAVIEYCQSNIDQLTREINDLFNDTTDAIVARVQDTYTRVMQRHEQYHRGVPEQDRDAFRLAFNGAIQDLIRLDSETSSASEVCGRRSVALEERRVDNRLSEAELALADQQITKADSCISTLIEEYQKIAHALSMMSSWEILK